MPELSRCFRTWLPPAYCLLPIALLVVVGCQPARRIHVLAESSESVTVKVVSPRQQGIPRTIAQPATIEPFEQTQLHAKVPGHVARLLADIGKRVRGPRFNEKGEEIEPGEVLAELAIPELVEEINLKQAHVRRSQAEVTQAKKGLTAAEAALTASQAFVRETKAGVTRTSALVARWESEAKRISSMVERGVLDAQTRDETVNQLRAAQANREEARAKVTSSEAAVARARADVARAEADVGAAEARLAVSRADAARSQALGGYMKIRAPFDGVVTSRQVATGDLLREGKMEGIFCVARLDPVRVVISVPEIDAALVEMGTPAVLTIQALQGQTIQTKITRTSWALHPTSRTLRAEVDLPNPEGKYRPGMYVHARIETQLLARWVLPADAVVKQGDDMVCFLIVEGKAVRTLILTGHGDGKFVEVLGKRKGAAWEAFSGQEKVASPGAELVDGQAVRLSD